MISLASDLQGKELLLVEVGLEERDRVTAPPLREILRRPEGCVFGESRGVACGDTANLPPVYTDSRRGIRHGGDQVRPGNFFAVG